MIIKFQSTLSQGERRFPTIPLLNNGEISIHALARRATTIRVNRSGVSTISIHALARRATLFLSVSYWTAKHFNPRSRKESDHILESAKIRDIHFNPRSRKESDCSGKTGASLTANFNPRSRKESDLQAASVL